MPNPFLAFIVYEISVFIGTDGLGQFALNSDPYEEYNILSDDSNLPFYSTSVVPTQIQWIVRNLGGYTEDVDRSHTTVYSVGDVAERRQRTPDSRLRPVGTTALHCL